MTDTSTIHGSSPNRKNDSKRRLALACGASFLAFLDVTITNLAVPGLGREFSAGLTSLSWVITLYTVMFAALLPSAGRLADVLGRERLLGVGIASFTLGSLVTAAAPSLSVLLLGRAIQGVGAAAMLPASLALVLIDIEPSRRAGAIGLWSAAAAGAAAAGPAIGGLIVHAFEWRALFLLNLPAGLFLGRAASRLKAAKAGSGTPPDMVGAAFLTTGLALLVLLATEGRIWGWTSVATLACACACLLTLGGAIHRSTRARVPAIEVSLWRNPTYASANLVSLLFGAALFAWLLQGVLFLVDVWGYDELQAGLAMTPGALAAAAVGIGIGRSSWRPSPRMLVVTGAGAIAATAVVLSLAAPGTPHFLAVWLPAGLLSGAGMGAVSVGVSSAAALSVAPMQFAAATGLNVSVRQVGGAIGIALLSVLLGGTGAASLAEYRHVYLFAAIACFGAAAIGVRLRLPSPVTAAAQQASEKIEAPAALEPGVGR